MAYIYKITNIINNKTYIGATKRTIEIRWKEHICDCTRDDRPLHVAMVKYGLENFKTELIEEVDDSIMNERERFWIELLGSFENGYNATYGGDGKPYINYNLVVDVFRRVRNQRETAKVLGMDEGYVSKILSIMGEPTVSSNGVYSYHSKPIASLNDDGTIAKVYNNALEVANIIFSKGDYKGSLVSIKERIQVVAKGRRKTAYGCKWIYLTTN